MPGRPISLLKRRRNILQPQNSCSITQVSAMKIDLDLEGVEVLDKENNQSHAPQKLLMTPETCGLSPILGPDDLTGGGAGHLSSGSRAKRLSFCDSGDENGNQSLNEEVICELTFQSENQDGTEFWDFKIPQSERNLTHLLLPPPVAASSGLSSPTSAPRLPIPLFQPPQTTALDSPSSPAVIESESAFDRSVDNVRELLDGMFDSSMSLVDMAAPNNSPMSSVRGGAGMSSSLFLDNNNLGILNIDEAAVNRKRKRMVEDSEKFSEAVLPSTSSSDRPAKMARTKYDRLPGFSGNFHPVAGGSTTLTRSRSDPCCSTSLQARDVAVDGACRPPPQEEVTTGDGGAVFLAPWEPTCCSCQDPGCQYGAKPKRRLSARERSIAAAAVGESTSKKRKPSSVWAPPNKKKSGGGEGDDSCFFRPPLPPPPPLPRKSVSSPSCCSAVNFSPPKLTRSLTIIPPGFLLPIREPERSEVDAAGLNDEDNDFVVLEDEEDAQEKEANLFSLKPTM